MVRGSTSERRTYTNIEVLDSIFNLFGFDFLSCTAFSWPTCRKTVHCDRFSRGGCALTKARNQDATKSCEINLLMSSRWGSRGRLIYSLKLKMVCFCELERKERDGEDIFSCECGVASKRSKAAWGLYDVVLFSYT